LVRPDVSPPNWLQGVLGVICVVAVLAWGMFVRARRQLALAERDRAASELELRVAQARQLERNRIAREMHDVLAHRLSLLSLQTGALELWPTAPPAEIARAAGVIRSSAHGALEDLREVIGVLRAERADDDRGDGVPERPQPIMVDLPMLIDESRKAGMRVVLECEVTDLRAVPEAVAHGVPDRAGGAHQCPQACRPRPGVSDRAGRGGRRPHRRDPQSVAGGCRAHHADPGRRHGHHRARRAGHAHRRAAAARPHPGG
jgi:hypothetical protein